MKEIGNNLYILWIILGALVVGVVGKRAGWFQLVSGTNKLLREQNTELRNINQLLRQQIETTIKQHAEEKAEWAEKYQDSKVQIAKLEGRIDQTINIPLVKIDESLKTLADTSKDNAASNQAILEQLELSARVLVTDTKNVATHVEDVKTDLENKA